MKKNSVIILAVVLFVAGFQIVTTRFYSLAGNKIIPLEINSNIFHVEVVDNSQKMQKGLGGKNGICERCGMLFVFPRSGKYAFWMKDMKFPLDLIWISQGRVVHIEKNIQPDFQGTLFPSEDADKVLEVNAGSIDSLEIKTGDTISF
ncbi:MAG: hypothetical protein UR99_C0009G0008 [Candidatus Moranbacteria bacterium GW2011_GWD2_36_12]|nr:MAG: hypothetical protein UR99_C0009G0008 [Candidatus Moranbacteria bacterium GW2011_GWD2_36_12]KKQ06781.1 MAG: hypothetical protein US16_C0009G0008 [Candidatus Moranbacteria bacterium GW2011_GWE2_36_40]